MKLRQPPSGRNIPNFTSLILKQIGRGDISHSYSTSESLFKAAKDGDELALRITEKVGKVNAIGFANVVDAYDPELISVGGSITLNNPELILNPIKRNVKEYAINRVPCIATTPLGGEVVLYGALVLAEKSDEF